MEEIVVLDNKNNILIEKLRNKNLPQINKKLPVKKNILLEKCLSLTKEQIVLKKNSELVNLKESCLNLIDKLMNDEIYWNNALNKFNFYIESKNIHISNQDSFCLSDKENLINSKNNKKNPGNLFFFKKIYIF